MIVVKLLVWAALMVSLVFSLGAISIAALSMFHYLKRPSAGPCADAHRKS